jgi:KUP system potassium uptake protein
VWTGILVVCVKYLAVVLRADNRGEGGTLALVSLLKAPWAVGAGILGSALEGLNLVSPAVQPWIVPAALFGPVIAVWFAFNEPALAFALLGFVFFWP